MLGVRNFLRTSRLRKRLVILIGLAFAVGLFSRLSDVSSFAGLLYPLVLVAFAGALVWSVFGMFRKVSVAPEGKKPTPRALRVLAGFTTVIIALPATIVIGQSTGLGVAPYSAEELADAAARAAEREAEERAEREAEERLASLAERMRGLSLDDARESLKLEGVDFSQENQCSTATPGTIADATVSGSTITLFVATEASSVPDVVGLTETIARAELEASCYQPNVVSYYALVPQGEVFATNPLPGEELEANETVTIYVSQRRTGVNPTGGAVARWLRSGEPNDEFSFGRPFERDDKLYFPIRATFPTTFDWRDDFDKGTGFGTALISDDFDKVVPVVVFYANQRAEAGVEQFFTVEVPLSDLTNQRPTTVSLRLVIRVGSRDAILHPEFNITWSG